MKAVLVLLALLSCCASNLLADDRFEFLQTLPNGLGVNIHFTDPRPGEVEQLAAAGFKFIRMDFSWSHIEKDDGSYDFSHYDTLMRNLDEHHIRALFILDYAHPKYDNNLSPHTDAGRAAFVKWTLASVKHFQNRGILWEMYNEPNGFWRPTLNTDDYVKLALAVGKAIKENFPNETYIGPATSGVDFPLLEACFKAGLLEYFDAVTVHPYRQHDPETAEADYRKLRLLIAQYAPKGKTIPIFSGEWGFSTAWAGFTPERQAKYLVRQWLTNIANDVPLSIWYDWHDDGPDPKEGEHHFGTVLHDVHDDRAEPYDAKPAYIAAKTLTTELNGYTFNKRLALPSPDDYVLLFSKDTSIKLVAWTTVNAGSREAVLRCGPCEFSSAGYLGQKLDALKSDFDNMEVARPFLRIRLTDAPQYLTPKAPIEGLMAFAKWKRLPLEIPIEAPATVSLNDEAAKVFCSPLSVTRSTPPTSLAATLFQSPFTQLGQRTTVVVTNPISITALSATANDLTLRLCARGGPFKGFIEIQNAGGSTLRDAIEFSDETIRTFRSPTAPGKPPMYSIRLLDKSRQPALAMDQVRLARVDDFNANSPSRYQLRPYGDPKVQSEQSLSFTTLAKPPLGNAAEVRCLRLDYKFSPGWKFILLQPKSPDLAKIDGQPKSLGMWIYGDNSQNVLRLRFRDETKQSHQSNADTTLNFKGWKYATFPLSQTNSSSWGGANDGKIHYPISWEALLLLDHVAAGAAEGWIAITEPTLVYQ